jgi:hypothetical protein
VNLGAKRQASAAAEPRIKAPTFTPARTFSPNLPSDDGRGPGSRTISDQPAPGGQMLGKAAWRHGGTAARRHGGTVARRHGGTAARWHGGTVARRYGGMAAWRYGGMAAWRHGGMAAWRQGHLARNRAVT